MIDVFEIGTIKRLPLGTDYNNVVAVVHGLLHRCPAGTELVIDGTGIGKPIADMFKYRGIVPWCVTATAAIEQSINHAKRTASVPKLMLISRIQALLFEGRLKVHADIPEAGAFLEELRDFRVEYTANGNMTFNARSGRHDDMVSAAAVAAWRLSDGAGGWGPPSLYLAAIMTGVRDKSRYPRPARWAIGCDLGKIADPSVVLVMRRTSVSAPELEAIAEDPPIVPMELVPVIDDPANKTPELLRREAIARAPTPNHPEAGKGGEIEHVNGPRAKITYAVGSLEWAAQQRKNQDD